MSELLPPWPLLSAFLIASSVLAVTPGPGVFYIVTRSITQGRTSGLASVAGLALGNFCNAIGAAIGLAALFAVSSVAFALFKYAGAAYLVWLGIQALRASAPATEPKIESLSLSRVFRDGFLVGILHPKTTLFFAAFLPQFVTSERSPMLQSVLLGSIFVTIALITDTIYALGAGFIAPRLRRRSKKAGRYLAGGTFIGLGIFTALSGSRTAK